MALPKASIGNSASFQIAGTPYVYSTEYTGTKTVDFKYVTRAVTIQSSGSGTGNKISFDGGTNEMTLVQNKVYRLDIKITQMKITRATGTISIVAELTSVEAWQAKTIVQDDYVTLYGCTDPEASNYTAGVVHDASLCEYGLAPTVLFHFNGNLTETCSSSEISASGTFLSDSNGKFSTAAKFNGALPSLAGDLSLLLHGDGTDGSTTFTDSSGANHQTLNTTADVEIDTAQVQTGFGTSSIKIDGAALGHLDITGSNDFNFGTDDFTIDFWVKFNSWNGGGNNGINVNGYIISSWNFISIDGSGVDNGNWGFQVYDRKVTFVNHDDVNGINYPEYIRASTQLSSPPEWQHIALTRSGTTGYLYIDGAISGTGGTFASGRYGYGPLEKDLEDGEDGLILGKPRIYPYPASGPYEPYQFDGWIDELRITKGAALWSGTTSFSVPTSAYILQSDFHINTNVPTGTTNNSLYWDDKFVFDMWVKIDDVDEDGTIIMPDSTDAGAGLFGLEWLGSGAWKLFLGASTELTIADAGVADDGTAGTWYHVAITRDGSDDIRFYRDGTSKDMVAPTVPGDVLFHFDDNLTDAAGGSAAVYNHASSAVATYAGSPVVAFGKEIKLLNQHVSENYAVSKDYISIPDPGVGAGAFTAEFWVTFDHSTSQKFFSNYTGTIGSGDFHLYLASISSSSGDQLHLYRNDGSLNDAVYFQKAGVSIGTNRTHVVLTRSLSGSDYKWRLYLNGTHIPNPFYDDLTTGQQSSSGDFILGRAGGGNGAFSKECTFDEFRLTKNDTVYTAGQDFTPITSPFATPSAGATYTATNGYEHATTINPNGTNASGTGYEVGGASDTPFEGSIDELRIVKGDSEVPTVQVDEYDCS